MEWLTLRACSQERRATDHKLQDALNTYNDRYNNTIYLAALDAIHKHSPKIESWKIGCMLQDAALAVLGSPYHAGKDCITSWLIWTIGQPEAKAIQAWIDLFTGLAPQPETQIEHYSFDVYCGTYDHLERGFVLHTCEHGSGGSFALLAGTICPNHRFGCGFEAPEDNSKPDIEPY